MAETPTTTETPQAQGQRASRTSDQDAPATSADVKLRYRGPSDVFKFADATAYRDGDPVTVSREVAEQVLNFPHDVFEEVND